MNIGLGFKRLVYAQVLLGIVAFCIAGRNPTLLLLAGTIAALSWYFTEGPGGKPLPRAMVTAMALIAVSWMVIQVFIVKAYVVAAVGQFVMWLQVILLYAPKNHRDYAQLLILSAMLVIGATVLSVSMIIGAVLVVYSLLSMVTALAFQLNTSREAVYQAVRDSVDRPGRVRPPAASASRGFRAQFLASSFALATVIVACGVLVFLVFPRFDARNPEPDVDSALGKATTGFAEHVDLDTAPGEPSTKEPIMHIKLSIGGESVGGQEQGWLVRGAVLDEYDHINRSWRRSQAAQALDLPVARPAPARIALNPNAARLNGVAEFTLRQPSGTRLFSIAPATAFQSRYLDRIAFNPHDQTLSSLADLSGVSIYRVDWSPIPIDTSFEAYADAVPWRDPPDGVAAALEVAQGWRVQPQRVRALAERILREAGIALNSDAASDPNADTDAILDDPAQRSRAVRAMGDYLRTHYSYSTSNPESTRETDPTIAFLFGHRFGHCEVFASALAALTRSVGIPSRVVTGFMASEYNNLGGYYVIRQAYAHAWTEAYLGPGRGWQAFDATPIDAVEAIHRRNRNWFSVVRDVYEYFEYHWLRAVVTYDDRDRRELIDNLRSAAASVFNDRSRFPGSWVHHARSLLHTRDTGAVSAGLTLVIIGALLLSTGLLIRNYVFHRRRVRALQLNNLPYFQRRAMVRALGFYLAMLDLLERKGYVRPAWQCPFAFAQELADANPMKFGPVVALTETFYEVRFGHRTMDEPRRRAVRLHLAHLQDALAGSN